MWQKLNDSSVLSVYHSLSVAVSEERLKCLGQNEERAIKMIMGPKNGSYEEMLVKQIISRWNRNLLGNKIGRNLNPTLKKKKKNLNKELKNQGPQAKFFYAKS